MSGMALSPWNVLAAGKLRTDEEEEKRRETGEKGRQWAGRPWERNEKEKKISKALEKVAAEVGAKHITSGTPMIIAFNSECCLTRPWRCSCNCVSLAESSVCLPHCWREEGRASPRQP